MLIQILYKRYATEIKYYSTKVFKKLRKSIDFFSSADLYSIYPHRVYEVFYGKQSNRRAMHGLLRVLFASKAYAEKRRSTQIAQFETQSDYRATRRNQKYAQRQSLLRRHTRAVVGGTARA